MAKILIFTAKWPASVEEMDGGSITVKQYIDALSKENDVDFLYLQKNKDEYLKPFAGVRHVFKENGSFLGYSNYDKNDGSKFLVRLQNMAYLNSLIQKQINDYDLIIIVHCLQAMGLQNVLSKTQMKKIIVLPMFLSDSYIRSNDVVPSKYTEEEKKILQAVGGIITPSSLERNDIIARYSVDPEKIYLIPRAINPCFFHQRPKPLGQTFDFCYVGSFKNQKNNLDAIIVLDELRKRGINCRLHLIGAVQDKALRQSCEEYGQKKNLTDSIIYHNIMPQTSLANLYGDMSFSISTSLCETFGRSIFESLASGLPTIVYKRLTAVSSFLGNSKGIIFVDNPQEMADEIAALFHDTKRYSLLSSEAKKTVAPFREAIQSKKLRTTINNFLAQQQANLSESGL
jgi:glycosyltransferase involved in cell wall biosynthesis